MLKRLCAFMAVLPIACGIWYYSDCTKTADAIEGCLVYSIDEDGVEDVEKRRLDADDCEYFRRVCDHRHVWYERPSCGCDRTRGLELLSRDGTNRSFCFSFDGGPNLFVEEDRYISISREAEGRLKACPESTALLERGL